MRKPCRPGECSLGVELSSFLSFFLSFFLLSFASVFPFLSSLLLFHEENNIKIFNCKAFLDQSFLFVGWCVLCGTSSRSVVFGAWLRANSSQPSPKARGFAGGNLIFSKPP